MLKQLRRKAFGLVITAAFGRLCVETRLVPRSTGGRTPAAFGRLCVETLCDQIVTAIGVAAAFGRLCVETYRRWLYRYYQLFSRLRAAVC